MASLSSSLSSVDLLLMRSKLPPSGPKNGGLRLARAVETGDSEAEADDKLHHRSVSRSTKITNKESLPPQTASLSSRRMSAMLKSPSVRKHIAESLGLDPDSPSVGDVIQSRLAAGSRVRTFSGGNNSSYTNEPVIRPTPNSLPVNIGVSVTNAALRTPPVTKRAESADRKRFRSVEDVTAVVESFGNETEQLLRRISMFQEPRDKNQPTMPQWRRSSLVDDVTGADNRTQFRLPTFDEFVRIHNETSRGDNDVTHKPFSSGNRSKPLPGLLSSFGGSFNELHRTTNALARVRPRDVVSPRSQFGESSFPASNRVNQSTFNGASKRREREYPKLVDVGVSSTVTLSSRSDGPRRSKRQPLPVNDVISPRAQDSPVSNGDDKHSMCSTSTPSRLPSATAIVRSTDDVVCNDTDSEAKQMNVKTSRRRVKAIKDSRTKPDLTEDELSRTPRRNKPPAHPQQSHPQQPHRKPKSPSNIAIDNAPTRRSVATRHRDTQQRPTTSGDVRRNPDYDSSIWDFLPSDDVSDLRRPTDTARSVVSPAASVPGVSSVQESTGPEPVPSRDTPTTNSDHSTAAVDGEINPGSTSTSTTKTEAKRSVEQIEAVREIVETEISYGNDLSVIHNEFYTPLKNNGLITVTQLDGIFLNLNQLIVNNEFFMKRLQANTLCCSIALTSSSPSGRQRGTSEHYASLIKTQSSTTVNIGRAFLESRHMLIAFETYCINQAAAVYLVDQLTQDRELLRIFLEELPKDRISLRKMDLKSFLMIPVQRVTKYPLLLDRLYKVTPEGHPDKHEIYLARKFIEQTLSSINARAIGSLKTKRRGSHPLQMLLKRNVAVENVELTQFVFDVLKWTRNDTHFLLVSRLMCVSLSGRRRSASTKYQSVHCVLATLGMSSCQNSSTVNIGNGQSVELIFPSTAVGPQQTKLRQAAVVLVKERTGKFTLLQAPMMMDRCIVSSNSPIVQSFELDEMNGETYRLKSDDLRETLRWYQRLQQLTMELGHWRRRRNALPNVMTHRRDEVT